MNLKYIVKYLEDLYPKSYADNWDNSGGQIINFDKEVKNIITTIDISDKMIDFAVENEADLIISHHPIFFGGIDRIDLSTYKGKLIQKIMNNKINIYSMHTNFDMASEGMTKLIANKLGYKKYQVLSIQDDNKGIGYGGVLDLGVDMSQEKLIELIKLKFGLENLNFYSPKKKNYRKLSFCGGSGGDFIRDAAKVSDIYLTGDIKHHDYQMAYELGVDIIDIGHYNSEFFFVEYVNKILKDKIKNVKIKTFDSNVFKSIIR